MANNVFNKFFNKKNEQATDSDSTKLEKKEPKISFEQIINKAARLPLVKIDRTAFLTNNLKKQCTPAQLQIAIEQGPLKAGVPVDTLDKLANDAIKTETLKVSAISAAAGIPGGFAMAATIPADLVQFYGFVLRIAQELAYLYGWEELFAESNSFDENLDSASQSQMILFIGVMSGVGAANVAVGKLFGEATSKAVAKKIAAQTLTQTWYYPIVQNVAALLGKQMTKAVFAKGLSKAIPIIGAGISGGLTLASFAPMSLKLKNHLSKLARMSPEEYEKYSESDIDLWICECGAYNKGKFCLECGAKKPVDSPQYLCDKCGWSPADPTKPPKFCPDCGDPFDDGDIVT